MSSQVLVRYDINTLMSHKQENDVLIKSLEKYCLTNNSHPLLIRDEFKHEMSNIVTSMLNGINPNDILLKTTIRNLLNKVSKKNYDESLVELKNIKYTDKQHFVILARDLLDRSMNDPVVLGGFTPSDNDNFISDINANIAKEFCQFHLDTESGDKITFKNILTNMCQEQFSEFMDESKRLDANNKHRVDNYKGFMNFIGLLYNRHILSNKIVVLCLLKIKKLIYESDWSKAESENLFGGYEKLILQLMYGVRKGKGKSKELLPALIKITKSIEVDNKTNTKLRVIPMLIQKSIMDNLNSLESGDVDGGEFTQKKSKRSKKHTK